MLPVPFGRRPSRRSVLLAVGALAVVVASGVTGRVHAVLFAAAVAYVSLAAGYLWRVRDDGDPLVVGGDVLVRRASAWLCLAFTGFVTALLTQAFAAGVATATVVYAGGVLDEAGVRAANS